jgi:heme-degrading monooxygenase HmoA
VADADSDRAGSAAEPALGARPGYCVRVVPSRAKAGQIDEYLAAHRTHHTAAVRRQPGFVSKVVLQAESDPQDMVMLLTWETPEQALAWVAHPLHDTASAAVREFSDRGGPPATADRRAYRVVEAALGSA